jgi:hypothetical protein
VPGNKVILSQKGFPRGVLSPYLYARPDVEDFPYGAKVVENLNVTKEGVLESRPGTKHVDECRSPSTEKKGIPFIFSTASADTYVAEFGHEYVEFLRAGVRVTETAINITALSLTSPCILTFGSAHGYTAGDHIIVSGIVGTVEVHGRYQVETPSTTTVSLYDTSGNAIDATAFTAWSSGGTAARVYKIASPYDEADLQKLKYAQSADVMYITHPSYQRRKLARTANTSWTLTEVTEGPTTSSPTALVVTAGGSGDGYTFEYQVTALSAGNVESLPGVEAGFAISAIALTNPVRVTTATHSYTDGQEVLLTGISGTTELNDRRFYIDVISATQFDLIGVDGTSYTAWTSGGSSYRTSDIITNADVGTLAAPITLAWTAVAGAVRYAIYKKLHGFYGFIGYSNTNSFSETTNITPVTEQGPPEYSEEFLTSSDYPAAVTIHEERAFFGGSDNQPDTVKGSCIGGYEDFSVHTPTIDSDKIEKSLGSTEINRIEHLVSLRKLVALTGSSEWACQGSDSGSGILTPASFNAVPYTNHGASYVRPATINNHILFVQSRGNVIRNLFYDFGKDSYDSLDVTLKASHFFRGYSIRDMAISKVPNSILWVIRSDGKLLSCTYSPDVNIIAWCGHKIAGSFGTGDAVAEQVVSIPENDSAAVGGEDATYILVKRTINSRTVRAWERMTSRAVDQDVRDRYVMFGPDHQEEFTNVDSFKTYDGRNTGSATMSLSMSSYLAGLEGTLTASTATFLSTDVGTDATSRQFFIWSSDVENEGELTERLVHNLIRCEVTAFTDSTHVTVRAHADVPTSLQATATTMWATAVRKVTGLRHLEGENISALGDGFVAANAFTDTTPITVTGGAATLEEFYACIHLGLPYICDLELLDIEFADGESLYGRKKDVSALEVYVKDSQSLYAGLAIPDSDADDYTGPTQGLDRGDDRDLDEEDADYPPPLKTEAIHVSFDHAPTEHGRAVIRHLEPRPVTILAVARVVEING